MKYFLAMTRTSLLAAQVPAYYAEGLCHVSGFHCIKVSSGQSWSSLFSSEKQREIVQKLNRTYNSLRAGKILAIPDDLVSAELLDYAPFERQLPLTEKQIIVDQNKLAWGAFDAKGQLLNWGPIASGTDICSDNRTKSCLTLTGTFRFFNKEDQRCTSGVYPLERGGGAKMFWCMFFHKGFALHGSNDIPGRRASHGCVRLFTPDAKWLNQHFVEIASDKNHQMGTLVIVKPVRKE
jgi:L,D-transpeptidase catalytic domain